MGGHGFKSQGLAVRTLHVDHTGPGGTLTKYTEVWVTGDPLIQAGAPDAIRQTGLWIGLGLPAGPHNHLSLQLGIGVRNQLCTTTPPKPLPAPPAALPNPTPITASVPAEQSLGRAFGSSGWLKRWVGFEVTAADLQAVPIPTPPSNESLFFRWELGRFTAPKRVTFFPVAIVATQRPTRPGPGAGFEQNFTLGISLLTGKKVTSGTDIDYFEVDAHTFL